MRGGRISWLYAAHNPKLKAAVAWYGRLSGASSEMTPKHPLDLVSALQAPVLGLYGAKDQGIPVSDVDAMREALTAATPIASGGQRFHGYTHWNVRWNSLTLPERIASSVFR